MFNSLHKVIRLHPEWAIHFFLIVVTLWVFSPVKDFEFINYDDDTFVSENPYIKNGLTGEGIRWAFSPTFDSNSPHADFWIPVTFISHMLAIEFFGLNPSGHHLINLMLHVLNTILLFEVFRKMTGALWKSAFVALLFAVHPLHVESVAWITERKDVLSTLFWILTLRAYQWYTQHPQIRRYCVVALCFALGLLSKPMVITLPFVLLLLDYWPLGRLPLQNHRTWGKLALEKAPLLILSLGCMVITILVQQKWETVGSLKTFPLWTRIGNALISYVNYMGKMIWPQGLAVFYPHLGKFLTIEQVIGAGLLLSGITFFAIWLIHRKPYLSVGWFWYLGTLIPVIGFIQVGFQGMADRYTYVPLIGLFIILAWGIPDLFGTGPYRKIFLGLSAGVVLLALMVSASLQIQHWRNSVTLFEHAKEVTQENYVAYHNLGLAYQERGKFEKAIQEYQKALDIKPNPALHNNLGVVLHNQGRFQEAVLEYEKALTLKPDYARAHYNLGNTYLKLKRHQKAIQEYHKTLVLQPNYVEAHFNLGITYGEMGKWDDAIQEFNLTLKKDPEFLEAKKYLDITKRLKSQKKIK